MPHPGSLPLYQQISELLIRDIAAGRLTDGTRLPPEREMAAGMGIAVGTLRKALAELAGKGMLERVQGSGNYIRARSGVDSVYALFRLELPQGGGLPTAAVLAVDRQAKPADAPAFGTAAEGHRIRRLRFLSGVPVAVEEIWLDGACADRLTAEDLSESLYLFYRQRLGLWIGWGRGRCPVGRPRPSRRAPARRCPASPASAGRRMARRWNFRGHGSIRRARNMWPGSDRGRR
jgi:GntR family transcriptional regulator